MLQGLPCTIAKICIYYQIIQEGEIDNTIGSNDVVVNYAGSSYGSGGL